MILILKTEAQNYKIDMSPITTNCLDYSLDEIRNLDLQTSNGKLPLNHLFEVSAEDTSRVIIRNAHPNLNNIGLYLNSGEMLVEGDIGGWTAYQMSGGKLTINGSVGHHAAGAMTNGELIIVGNAGHSLGGAESGDIKGIRGGTVIVRGNAGDYLGDRMRAGLIIVTGSTGNYCGSRMIAGSIVVYQKIGTQLGFNMRRGSLLISHAEMQHLPNFFTSPRYQGVGFLPLFLKHLQTLDQNFSDWHVSHYAHRCIGDTSIGGLGEIFFI